MNERALHPTCPKCESQSVELAYELDSEPGMDRVTCQCQVCEHAWHHMVNRREMEADGSMRRTMLQAHRQVETLIEGGDVWIEDFPAYKMAVWDLWVQLLLSGTLPEEAVL